MGQENSCIIKHFSHYCSLSEDEKKLLITLEESPTDIKSGTILWEMGAPANEFCTLKSGWAYSYRHLENGDRQILEVFLPGDIIGLREFAFSQRLENVRMIDDGVICHFPHKRMLEIFRQSLPLTSVMFAIGSRQQALMTERLVTLARRSARQKMAHFLYEMYLSCAKPTRILATSSACRSPRSSWPMCWGLARFTLAAPLPHSARMGWCFVIATT